MADNTSQPLFHKGVTRLTIDNSVILSVAGCFETAATAAIIGTEGERIELYGWYHHPSSLFEKQSTAM